MRIEKLFVHRDMGLYAARLASLNERRHERVAARRGVVSRTVRPAAPRASVVASKPTSVQSLLFDRSAGWTPSKAKAWAKSHGYRHGKVDVTEQYVRLRQQDPNKSAEKRTIPFGRGIRAVVAREVKEPMRTKATEARRRRRPAAKKKKKTVKRARVRRRRQARETAVSEARRPRRRRRKAAPKRATTRRRRRRVSEAWRGDSAGHSRAAKKGWRRKKRKSAPKRRRARRRRTREAASYSAPRRRRSSHVMQQAPRRRRRRSRGMFEPRRGGPGLSTGEFVVAVVSGGLGFVLADGLDRFLATYDPAAAEKPTDKFTSDGAGTLANTLNVAARPSWMRLGVGLGVAAVPAIGASYIRSPMIRSSMQGAAIGAGISFFKTLWNNLLMPMLTPKDTSPASLQKSVIARLYPAEVAAHVNLEAKQTYVASAGSGALSGATDVGPYALAGDSPYPDAAQALRREAGMSAPSGVAEQYPSLQNTWGTGGPGSDYPTAAQALRREAGMSAPAATGNPGQPGVSDEQWAPGPPPLPGPGPQAQPGEDPSCGCMGDGEQYLGYLGDEAKDDSAALLPSIE